MARNYKELQEKMDRASRADNERNVREELKRMAGQGVPTRKAVRTVKPATSAAKTLVRDPRIR